MDADGRKGHALFLLKELAKFKLVGLHFLRCVRFDNDEVIHARREIVLHETEGFPEAAFDEVSPDGVSAAAADGNAHAGGAVVFATEGERGERMGGAFFSGVEECVKAETSTKALVAGEFVAKFGWRRAVHERILTVHGGIRNVS